MAERLLLKNAKVLTCAGDVNEKPFDGDVLIEGNQIAQVSPGRLEVDPAAVRVVGFDVDGGERELECEGFGASLLQHEIDHLDGILTLHRAEPPERYRAMAALLALDGHLLAA